MTGNVICTCPKADTCPPVRAQVCGSDGKTYNNECLLKVAACVNKKPINKLHNGPCSEYALELHYCCKGCNLNHQVNYIASHNVTCTFEASVIHSLILVQERISAFDKLTAKVSVLKIHKQF